MRDEGYDTALIWLNGHVANETVNRFPDQNKPFCMNCGERTITDCEGCKTSIPGYLWGSLSTRPIKVPSYCGGCGKSFPWTDRRIEAALQLFAEEVSPEEKPQLEESIRAIAKDTPAATLAMTRLKKAIAKVSAPVGKAVNDILVSLASEAIKRQFMSP